MKTTSAMHADARSSCRERAGTVVTAASAKRPGAAPADRGYTLVELLVAVGIAGVVVTIAVPTYSSYVEKTRVTRAVVEIQLLESAIKTYATENNYSLPDSLSDIYDVVLPDPTTSSKAKDGKSKAKDSPAKDVSDVSTGAPLDPWGRPYQYLNHADVTGKGDMRRDRFLNPLNSDYDLYSMGKDGQSKPQLSFKTSQDDIIRAADGGYVGLASDF